MFFESSLLRLLLVTIRQSCSLPGADFNHFLNESYLALTASLHAVFLRRPTCFIVGSGFSSLDEFGKVLGPLGRLVEPCLLRSRVFPKDGTQDSAQWRQAVLIPAFQRVVDGDGGLAKLDQLVFC